MEEHEKGPIVLKSKIFSAELELKDGKAVGMDEVSAEMLKNLGEKVMPEICEICQNMYGEGNGQMNLQ